MNTPTAPMLAEGTLVQFREDTPQYLANRDITYMVEQAPLGGSHSVDGTNGKAYVWLVAATDLSLPWSKARRRTGYVDALTVTGHTDQRARAHRNANR